MGLQQLPVEPVEQADAGLLPLRGHSFRGFQVHDRYPLGAQQGSLAHGRKVAVGVVDGSSLDPPPLVRQDHEGRQVLVLGAQAVDRPGPQGRTARNGKAGVHQEAAHRVAAGVGVERPDHGHVVDAGGQMGKDLGNFDAGLAVPGELEGTPDVDSLFQAAVNAGHRGAVVAVQGRLGVEGVHLAGRAEHEEKDAGLGLARQVGWLGGQRIAGGPGSGQQAVLVEHGGERHRSQPLAEAIDELPPPQTRVVCGRHRLHVAAELHPVLSQEQLALAGS